MVQYIDKYNNSNIQFNGVDVAVSTKNKKVGLADILNATSEDLVDIASENGGKLPTIVNAVEIDWNEAQVSTPDGTETVNTSGEMLSLVQRALNSTPDLSGYVRFEDLDNPEVVDFIMTISWTGGGINPSAVQPNGTAVLTKGTVTALYRSGRTEDVTSSATFSAVNGSISGTTYTASNTGGTDTISVSHKGITAAATIDIIVEPQRLTAQLGHGAVYNTAEYNDTHVALHDNLEITINTNDDDYLFIKVDKRDTVRNLYVGTIRDVQYAIILNTPQTVGDYKYYQSRDTYNEAVGVPFIINYIEND